MLRTRVVTAVVLFAAFLVALFWLPPLGWLIFVTLVVAVAAWEWGGLMKLQAKARRVLGFLFVVVCTVLAAIDPAAVGLGVGFHEAAWRFGIYFYVPAAIFWLLVVPVWLVQRWPLSSLPLGLMTGGALILPAWLALLQLRQAGPWVVLAIMSAVWLADIGAYFAGRRFGTHKLAPRISPGKTWEGALGGVVAVLIYGALLSSVWPTPPLGHWVGWMVVLVLLTAISVVGDLFESLLKRQAGLKDSSQILPGHGGVLDRIDSLTSTLPLVALIWLLLLRR